MQGLEDVAVLHADAQALGADSGNVLIIAEALAEASRSGGDSWRLLISRDDDGPYTVATVRQLLSTRDASSTIDLETWDGGQSGPSLVAGCAS